MDDKAYETSVANASALFIVIFFHFTNPNTTLIIVPPAPSMGAFPWRASLSATQPVLTYQSVKLIQTRI